MTAFNELFASAGNSQSATSSRALAGTATLTAIAEKLVLEITQLINAEPETYGELVAISRTGSKALDDLIDVTTDLDAVDLDFLRQLPETELESMLKSQQSKRSRTKSKEMTWSNYTSMLSAAICENLIRKATGKAKGNVGAHATTSTYSDNRLFELANDQDALRKEIRNVQSKKSIAKSKASFDENDEKWQILLEAERQLKSIRDTGSVAPSTKTVYVDTTKVYLRELLAEIDIQGLKAVSAKELLELIKSKAFAEDEEPIDDQDDSELFNADNDADQALADQVAKEFFDDASNQ